MNFLKFLFQRKQSEDSLTEVDAANYSNYIHNEIISFKKVTYTSWTVILPAAHRMSARLIVQKYGLQQAKDLYELKVRNYDKENKVPLASILNVESPATTRDAIESTELLMFKIANHLLAQGVPIETVSPAFESFAINTGRKAIGEIYTSILLKSTFEAVQSNELS